jgi:hypothetical protein
VQSLCREAGGECFLRLISHPLAMIPVREVFPCLSHKGDHTPEMKPLRNVSPKDFGEFLFFGSQFH